MPKWLEGIVSNMKGNGKKPTKVQYIVLIVLGAVLILIISNLFSKDEADEPNMEPPSTITAPDDEEAWKQTPASNATAEIADLEASYEEDLGQLLEKIEGISDVEVMVNLDATKEQIYQKNLIIGTQVTNETDQNGGNRKIDDETREQTIVIVRQGEKEIPLLVQTKKPNVRGVLVVANGVDNLEVKKWVHDAVSKVLDVPVHRVSVMPKK
ncbi:MULTISPECIES: stage III sporulation protein AG [Gracilibacillus]|uniref:stage III sporulation protein AG n=1 Tax=Gracilibacillus TaxID=74385 RepID=UPI00098E9B5C|nr:MULTISPECIES: stage III sporulation protein AG [Gracilibacillus]